MYCMARTFGRGRTRKVADTEAVNFCYATVLPRCRIALTVNEVCLLMLPPKGCHQRGGRHRRSLCVSGSWLSERCYSHSTSVHCTKLLGVKLLGLKLLGLKLVDMYSGQFPSAGPRTYLVTYSRTPTHLLACLALLTHVLTCYSGDRAMLRAAQAAQARS